MQAQEQVDRERRPTPHEQFTAQLAEARALLASARAHGEHARMLREEQERLERIYYGRRFILIRF